MTKQTELAPKFKKGDLACWSGNSDKTDGFLTIDAPEEITKIIYRKGEFYYVQDGQEWTGDNLLTLEETKELLNYFSTQYLSFPL